MHDRLLLLDVLHILPDGLQRGLGIVLVPLRLALLFIRIFGTRISIYLSVYNQLLSSFHRVLMEIKLFPTLGFNLDIFCSES